MSFAVMIADHDYPFPVWCACGGKNMMYEDFLRGEYVIVCVIMYVRNAEDRLTRKKGK